jgi:hypothetical protein
MILDGKVDEGIGARWTVSRLLDDQSRALFPAQIATCRISRRQRGIQSFIELALGRIECFSHCIDHVLANQDIPLAGVAIPDPVACPGHAVLSRVRGSMPGKYDHPNLSPADRAVGSLEPFEDSIRIKAIREFLEVLGQEVLISASLGCNHSNASLRSANSSRIPVAGGDGHSNFFCVRVYRDNRKRHVISPTLVCPAPLIVPRYCQEHEAEASSYRLTGWHTGSRSGPRSWH